MAQNMRRHPLLEERRLLPGSDCDVLLKTMSEAVPRHRLTAPVEEQLGRLGLRANRQPGPQHGLGLAPQGQNALAPPFAFDPNRSERALREISLEWPSWATTSTAPTDFETL
jgi:hypothetical protein